MNKLWHRYSPWIHLSGWLMMMIFTAGMVWGSVSKYDGRISAVETTQTKQDKKITRMDYNVQMIGRAVGVRPLEKDRDEPD